MTRNYLTADLGDGCLLAIDTRHQSCRVYRLSGQATTAWVNLSAAQARRLRDELDAWLRDVASPDTPVGWMMSFDDYELVSDLEHRSSLLRVRRGDRTAEVTDWRSFHELVAEVERQLSGELMTEPTTPAAPAANKEGERG